MKINGLYNFFMHRSLNSGFTYSFIARIVVLGCLFFPTAYLQAGPHSSGYYPDHPKVPDAHEHLGHNGTFISIGSWYNVSESESQKRAQELCEEDAQTCIDEYWRFYDEYSARCAAAGGFAICRYEHWGLGCDQIPCEQAANSFPKESWICPPEDDTATYSACAADCECLTNFSWSNDSDTGTNNSAINAVIGAF